MSVSVVVHSRIPQANRHVEERVALAIRKAAFDIEAHAKARAPVDTGALKGGINANGDGKEWRVDSPAEYSIFQEFGTRFQPAHPFLVPALMQVRGSLAAAMRNLA